ncbi:hypothetical protein BGE01nite_49240 [Brevifollis gellanilyticus]|uniref:Ig-like domain-containing protein n=1 Tax=Brevifollis gellanilyticus TaxID=748831 RepID=A0A512MFW1_9BACT|nr:hypothetical protein BGE01nite_49240 [Brevifollis gellanilyticus]
MLAVAPANDNKANATLIAGANVVVNDNCAEATVEPGDFAQKTMWWQWTAPASGTVALDIVNSGAPHLALQVWLKETSGAVTGRVAYDDGEMYNTGYRPSVGFSVVQGSTYLIGLGTVNTSATTSFRLELILNGSHVISSMPFNGSVTMANDLFSQRITLTGSHAASMAYNTSASIEAGEPAEAGIRTFWWSYTPTANGRLSLSTVNGDAISKNMGVYIGTVVNSLKLLESKSTSYGSGDLSITLPVTAGTTYQISLGSFESVSTSGALVLTLALDANADVSGLTIPNQATLANDMFVARSTLSGSYVSGMGYNRPATIEAGEPSALGTRTLWWTYRPASDGRLSITTDGSTLHSKNVGVYLGNSVSSLKEAAFRTTSYGNENLTFSFPVTADTDYQIAVGAFADEVGHVILTLQLDAAADVTDLNIPNPASTQNDAFAQRMLLTGREVSAIGYTASATNEIGEPVTSGAQSLWWTYRPPAAGRLVISSQGSDNFAKTLAVYLGTNLNGLRLVANLTNQYNSSTGNLVTLSFPVTANTDYQVSLGNLDSNQAGDAAVISFSLDDDSDVNDLNLGAPATAINDLFASSTPLTGSVVSGIGYNTGAVREALEPAATKERTLWWSWTAPSTGLAMVDTTGSDAIQKWVSVWTGNSLSGLSQVAVSTRSQAPGVLFPITQGETYRIAVGNDSSSSLTNGSVIMSIVSASSSPVLVAPLASRFIPVGQPLVLNATAGGLGLSWQWKKGSTTLSNITPNFTDIFPDLSDAGTYSVTVAGPGGNTVSTANIGIINTAPQGVTVHEGQDLQLEVQAQGPGLGYQWFRDGISLTASERVTGVAGDQLSITGMTALDAGDYHCVVSMPDAVNPNNRITMSSGLFTVTGNYRAVAFGGPYVWQVGRNITEVLGKRFGPTSFKITGLPAGVSYGTATGQLSGNPTAAGTGFFKVIASKDGVAGPERSIAFTVIALDADALGTFNGLVTRSDTFLDAKYGGSINVVTTTSGSFTGTMKLGTTAHPLKGRLLDGGEGTASAGLVLTRKDKTTFTLNLTVDLDDGHLTGTLVDGSKNTTVEAWRSIWTKNLSPAALSTTYTAALMPPEAPEGETATYPPGDGVSFISISSLGVVTWKGTLADGTAITASTTMGPGGQIPLFTMLYTAAAPGSITGWMTAAKQGYNDPQLDGTAHWSKSRQSSGSMAYKNGFTAHDLTVGGSSFVKPLANMIILGLDDQPGNAQISFGQGGLSQQASTSLQISLANKPVLTGATLPKLAMTLNVSSATNLGLITGSFELAEAPPSKVKRTVKFTGAVVNRLGAGVGHFLLPQLPVSSSSPVLSGWMELEPAD